MSRNADWKLPSRSAAFSDASNVATASSTSSRILHRRRIGILGDFNPEFRSHPATTDSLQHAARKLDLKVDSQWIPTRR